MMATPTDLEAFAAGFFISEGIIQSGSDILDVDIEEQPLGWQVNVRVLAACEHQLKLKRRSMAGPSGCGLCGVDSLTSAMDLNGLRATVSGSVRFDETVILQAKALLNQLQKQHQHTRGHHSAALFDRDAANLLALSEDVGRHSALDKTIGAATLQQASLTDSFAIITSRCSHDLVVKCGRAGIPCLVTLAVQSAVALGVTLFCFQQSGLHKFN